MNSLRSVSTSEAHDASGNIGHPQSCMGSNCFKSHVSLICCVPAIMVEREELGLNTTGIGDNLG